MTTETHTYSTPKPRFFYGWLVVLVAFCTTFVIAGTFVTFGQLIGPLSMTFGWSVGLIGLASTVRQLTYLGTTLVIGRLTDTIGPRKIMTAGAVLAGAASIALYVVNDPLLFYIMLTIILSVGLSMIGGTPAQAAVARWFEHKRGLALAISSMGGSLGGVVMAPVVQYLLGMGNWRIVFAVLGVGLLIALFPLIALIMRDTPESEGTVADGVKAIPVNAQMANQTSIPSRRQTGWTYPSLLRSDIFWMLTIGYFFASSLYTLIEVYQFSILTQQGIDGGTAALYISLYSLSAALSKFGWGYWADRVDIRKLTIFALCFNALSLALLPLASDTPLFLLYALMGGACGGGQSSLLPALIAQKFGHRSFGTVTGLFSPIALIAPALLVPLAGFVFDVTHSYMLIFVGVAMSAVVCSSTLMRLPQQAVE